MTTITHQQAADMMKHTNSFFTVTYVKRTTGEVRTMNCRTGVAKYVTGEGLKYDAKAKNLLPVWERKYDGSEGAECYRMVDLNTVQSLNIDNQHYDVV